MGELVWWTVSETGSIRTSGGLNDGIMAERGEKQAAHLCSGGRSPLSSSPALCDRNSAASGT